LIQTRPLNTEMEKRDFACWLNLTLRELGRAVRDGKRNLPATLVVDALDSDHPSVVRFRTQCVDENGRRRRTVISDDLTDLAIVPAGVRQEGGSRNRRGEGGHGMTR
jgi:hypothetical protein